MMKLAVAFKSFFFKKNKNLFWLLCSLQCICEVQKKFTADDYTKVPKLVKCEIIFWDEN